MKKLIVLTATLLLFACNKKTETNDTKHLTEERGEITDSTNAASSSADGLQLGVFPFPPEVDGCSCYFSRNQQEFHDEKYVYLDDYGNNAYLNVDGKQVKIKMEEGDFDPENFTKTISNDEFTVTIEGRKIKELEEVMMFEGKMTVKDKNGAATTTAIYGECGC